MPQKNKDNECGRVSWEEMGELAWRIPSRLVDNRDARWILVELERFQRSEGNFGFADYCRWLDQTIIPFLALLVG